MNIWKISSIWSSHDGKESSVLDIFLKYNIVFARLNTEQYIEKVKKDDLIAISDGPKIISIAKVISEPNKITSLDINISEEDKKIFAHEDLVIGAKVNIIYLNEDEICSMEKMEVSLNNYSDKKSNKFKITSNTYTILNNDINSKNLFNSNLKYRIPIYQRPYSWSEEQIEIFINDLFASYIMDDNIFIGTMQLSEKKYLTKDTYYQEVIDGQQRITTILLLLKYLKNEHSDIIDDYIFDTLETQVNNEEENEKLKRILEKGIIDDEYNIYVKNYKLIKNYFEKNIEKMKNMEKEFNINSFLEYLFNDVYFVAIETRAGLAKTLQIFNAINTTGLDLNLSDIFKIKLFDYLKSCGKDDKVFNSIDSLYEKIERYNSKLGKKIISMEGVLEIYKYYLISKYELNVNLWKMGVDTFFERLFDTLLSIKNWPGFDKINKMDNVLSIETINKIIDVRYNWEKQYYGNNSGYNNFDTMLSMRLIWWSRYSSYWILPFLYLIKNNEDYDNYEKILKSISRLYVVYSILYQKKINEIVNFTKEIYKEILESENIDKIIKDIKDKYLSKIENSNLKEIISGNIFWNNKLKNILTRMSAAIEEKQNGNQDLKEIEKLIFDNEIDIEHIQPRNDENEYNRESIKNYWGDLLLNSLGNLVVLERTINRSISNANFYKKKVKYKEKSKLEIVKKICDYDEWTKEIAQERLENEVKKIIKYLKEEGEWR